jgi:hypothetical protein
VIVSAGTSTSSLLLPLKTLVDAPFINTLFTTKIPVPQPVDNPSVFSCATVVASCRVNRAQTS